MTKSVTSDQFLYSRVKQRLLDNEEMTTKAEQQNDTEATRHPTPDALGRNPLRMLDPSRGC